MEKPESSQEAVQQEEQAGTSSSTDEKKEPSVGSSETQPSFDGAVDKQKSVDINRLAGTMFEKSAEYLQGELSATVEDYKLLEEMNRVTISKYSDMKQIAANVSKALQDLNDKYKSLQPYLHQIDQIEENVLKLEQAAYKLDAYSKRLEAKFKQLEKR